MDACRASSCCHGARNVPWTEVPVVPSVRATRAVPVPAAEAEAVVVVPQQARGVPQRRWRSWISSPQRRPMRLNTRWTNEPLPHSTTSRNIFSTDSPLTGEFRVRRAENTIRSMRTLVRIDGRKTIQMQSSTLSISGCFDNGQNRDPIGYYRSRRYCTSQQLLINVRTLIRTILLSHIPSGNVHLSH